MPKYLLKVNYTPEGARGLHKDGGVKRREVAMNTAKSLGGQIEAFYFAFGDADVITLCDMPDDVTMAALSLAVTETGAAETSTTVLFSAEQMDAAVSKHSAYRKPGL